MVIILISLENMMKAGRPTKCEIAEAILSDDKPICQVACVLRVDRGTLRDWKKKHPEFSTVTGAGHYGRF